MTLEHFPPHTYWFPEFKNVQMKGSLFFAPSLQNYYSDQGTFGIQTIKASFFFLWLKESQAGMNPSTAVGGRGVQASTLLTVSLSPPSFQSVPCACRENSLSAVLPQTKPRPTYKAGRGGKGC